jgi:hypothetical protein
MHSVLMSVAAARAEAPAHMPAIVAAMFVSIMLVCMPMHKGFLRLHIKDRSSIYR